jgi:hypothetical protein
LRPTHQGQKLVVEKLPLLVLQSPARNPLRCPQAAARSR